MTSFICIYFVMCIVFAHGSNITNDERKIQTAGSVDHAPENNVKIYLSKHLPNVTEKNVGRNLKLKCEAVFIGPNFNIEGLNVSSSEVVYKDITDGNKKVNVFWLKNDVVINSKREKILIRKIIVNDSLVTSIRISKLEVEDSGVYTCVLGNLTGEVRSSTRLKVLDDGDSKAELPTYEPLYPEAERKDGVPPKTVHSPITIVDNGPNIHGITERSSKKLDGNEFHHKSDRALEPICQLYTGITCSKFFQDQYVFIPHTQSQIILERKLSEAFKVVSQSKEISSNCEDYALPSLCYSTFPVCRKPNESNLLFFKKMSAVENFNENSKKFSSQVDGYPGMSVHFENLPPSGLPAHLNPNNSIRISRDTSNKHIESRFKREKFIDFPSPTDPNEKNIGNLYEFISLRRVCKQDCEILENELCQKEYAIAKRHPHIGQQLNLEECVHLPDNEPDCLEVGLVKETGTDEDCFWEAGITYRGKVNVTSLGLPCIKWSHQLRIKLNTYPELAGGHNYCRNPGGKEQQPWCYADKEILERQLCDIPKCSQRIWIYIISSITCICVLMTVLTVCICCKHRPKDNATTIRNINLPNADKNIYGNSRLNSPIEMNDLMSNQNSIPPAPGRSPRTNGQIRVPQYSLSQIKFLEELGEGAFGKVYKGELRQGNESMFVAVKALKENASAKTQADFRREIDLISDLRHDNIVCIVGVALREEPLCMLFEFMARGDLHEFLMGRAPPGGSGLPSLRLLTIAHHIASGMEYLAGHHYVHRDLAARNCLVADNFVVKISDFGLSRDIYSSDYYRVQSKSLLPVRWMPPESILYGKFTTESDIWSYGVVLWEIYSYGLQPYYGYSNQEVISMVRGGELLGCPINCPTPVYNLMRECWRQQPPRRPHFDEINSRLVAWIHMGGCEAGSGVSESSNASSIAGASNSVHGSIRNVRQPHADHRERMPLLDSSSGSFKKFSSSECGDSLPRHSAKKGSCGSLLDTQGLERSHSKSSTVVRME